MAVAGVLPPSAVAPADLDDLTLARAQRGDARAQGALIRTHQRAVYALVSRMLVGRPAQIDDVAQETFVKILRALPRFDPAGAASLNTWMLTIAARTCLDVLRRPNRAGGEDPLHSLESGLVAPDEIASGKETAARIERAMTELPADHRAVLVLRAYHDLDYPEIASALEIAEGTVKSRLARARAELRRVMDERRERSER